MSQHNCPFCHLEKSRITLDNDSAVAFIDAFPVTEGHTLIVPKRHVVSLFDLSEAELSEVWKLVSLVRGKLMGELKTDGFNIGVNDGPAAGQTVMHAHVHVIPRRKNDVADSRGGIRWVMPNKAAYWAKGNK